MNLSDILNRDLCRVRLHARRKEDMLNEIAEILKEHDALSGFTQEQIAAALREREQLGSTGFGDGLALPHCRLPGLKQFVLGIGLSPRGAAFDALDGKKAHLFCFLAGPEEKPNEYVKVLAEISGVLRNESARRELRKAPTATALYESFMRHASPESAEGGARRRKLLMLVLQEEDLVTEVMELFVEMGIRGASVLESRGMGNILTRVPLFASFMNFLGTREEFHRTVFALVPDEQLPRLIQSIEEITGDMESHSGAMALALDISMLKGSLESI
ncbi:PTS sugar transporter subunit IIA [Kiritimatiella glycovorans]|uniref:EIIABC-Fru n=1 Tax=Kiritimatiella glycovorans TaxID=1307763 RepID=A0A0G3EF95_9BACT|nr:PTS sugar transporter subunit IIA [Kiritimatiella glycovorans]AKJ63450.1 EIIABC-Fru [Kiritimatiella glycovorans]